MVMNLSTAYIGLINPKSPDNVGMVLRAAGCYEAKQIFYTGDRLARARRFRTDTKNAQAKIPLTYADDFFNIDFATQGTQFVAVELIQGATPLMDFVHPENAFYIFGPEDDTIEKPIIERCAATIYIPTIGCMNLAAAVNVVLYDRMSKGSRDVIIQRPIISNRDTNNKMKI
jgi:tRNA(Leu) C34 or U34 (ribose-2'-O)-methylase TrmL